MKKLLVVLTLLLTLTRLYAIEGMWLPILLEKLNEKEMQEMGLRLTAEDIYSVNQSSLKDAIVFSEGAVPVQSSHRMALSSQTIIADEEPYKGLVQLNTII
jgi:hypothetical protein